MTQIKKGVVLIGHGGVPTDCPEEYISMLKRLESQRRKTNSPPSKEEIEIDRIVRHWPRNEKNDPYHAGLQSLAGFLQAVLEGFYLEIAYNEFCAPTIPEAVKRLVRRGVADVTLVTTMFTPGGSHSEMEIPEEMGELIKQYPDLSIAYAWPYDLNHVAQFLCGHIENFRNSSNSSISSAEA